MDYIATALGNTVNVVFTRTATGLEAVVDGRSYILEVVEIESGVYWLNWNGRSLEAAVVRDGERYVVSIGRRRIPVEMMDPRKALHQAARRGHDGVVEIRAPMPGKIVRVLAAEGTPVEANQGIVVMEAMKMQNEIRAPKAGTVRNVQVAEGAAVSAGALLATVE